MNVMLVVSKMVPDVMKAKNENVAFLVVEN